MSKIFYEISQRDNEIADLNVHNALGDKTKKEYINLVIYIKHKILGFTEENELRRNGDLVVREI